MDIQKFTSKSQEVIRNAQEIALSRSQMQVDSTHILYSLLTQEESIVRTIFSKLEVDVDKIKGQT